MQRLCVCEGERWSRVEHVGNKILVESESVSPCLLLPSAAQAAFLPEAHTQADF